MKKAKILTVLGVMLAMSMTGCKGGKTSEETQKPSSSAEPSTVQPTSQPTSQPATTTSQPASTTSQPASTSQPATTTSQPATTTSEEPPAPQHKHDYKKVENEEYPQAEGATATEYYECAEDKAGAIQWEAKNYDASSSEIEATANDGSIRFNSSQQANAAGDGVTGGGHLIYKINVHEAVAKAGLDFYIQAHNQNKAIFDAVAGDSGAGKDFVDGKVVDATKRYALYVNDERIPLGDDPGASTAKAWFSFPVEFALKKGVNKIELVSMGGYRAKMYNFRLTGLPHYEHVANYKQLAAKVNDDGKPVYVGEDKFLGNTAIEIAFKDFKDAPANPSGTNPWYMAKNSFATWTINVDKAIEGAKIYFSLECSSTTHIARHLFNEAKYNAEHPDAPVDLPSQSPDATTEDDWRYAVAVGETNYPLKNNGTLGESGVKEINKQYYVYFTDINLAAGANVIKLTQCNLGYRMKFNQNVRIVYNTDATITGEDYVPPHAHSWTVGDADANGVSAVSCSGCTQTGIQFDGYTGDNATAIDGDMKVTKNFQFKWNLNMPKAGKVALLMSFAYSAGNGAQKFGTGYEIKVGDNNGTITIENVAFNTLIPQAPDTAFVQIGTVDVPAGQIEFDYKHGNQGTRLISDKLVRLIYVD